MGSEEGAETRPSPGSLLAKNLCRRKEGAETSLPSDSSLAKKFGVSLGFSLAKRVGVSYKPPGPSRVGGRDRSLPRPSGSNPPHFKHEVEGRAVVYTEPRGLSSGVCSQRPSGLAELRDLDKRERRGSPERFLRGTVQARPLGARGGTARGGPDETGRMAAADGGPGVAVPVELRRERHMVCVEYPGVVRDVSKVLQTLGGEEGVSRVRSGASPGTRGEV